jgi:hypothetical protein
MWRCPEDIAPASKFELGDPIMGKALVRFQGFEFYGSGSCLCWLCNHRSIFSHHSRSYLSDTSHSLLFSLSLYFVYALATYETQTSHFECQFFVCPLLSTPNAKPLSLRKRCLTPTYPAPLGLIILLRPVGPIPGPCPAAEKFILPAETLCGCRVAELVDQPCKEHV